MGKIHKLPKHLIPKIAAGEVVERPASIVKELIENALDATATTIEVNIEHGGTTRIAVLDNGEGMDETDIAKCFNLHTTSKIATEQDLIGINSLGFRGEALASIVSVSKVKIKSRPPQDTLGTEITIEAGKVMARQAIGMSAGTQVLVENIFFNTPGRKKFLKTPQTEFRHILEVVINNALAHSNVEFILTHNNKTICNLNRNDTYETRIQKTLGHDFLTKTLPIRNKEGHFKITGFLVKPQFCSKHRNNQYIFINGRSTKNTLINSLIRTVYKDFIDASTHPQFVLHLQVPADLVDVNIHPRKEIVRFVTETDIGKFVQKNLKKVLQKYDLTYQTDILGTPLNTEKAAKHALKTLKKSVELWDMRETPTQMPKILQVHNLYLITQTKEGFLIIDQHAAHEKILYEQLLQALDTNSNKNATLQLKQPVVIETNIIETQRLNDNLAKFQTLGFEIEPFGPNTFKIAAIPDILQDQNPAQLVKELLAATQENGTLKNSKELLLKTISYLACRSAIKAGDLLTQEESLKLITKLMKCKTRYTCPHGRPAIIRVNLQDLDRMFRRG